MLYGSLINQKDVKQAIEEVLCDYSIEDIETSLSVSNNINSMILLYLSARQAEGLSNSTLTSYKRVLKKFFKYTKKSLENITTIDIRMYLINYSETGVKNSTIATETNVLRAFFCMA